MRRARKPARRWAGRWRSDQTGKKGETDDRPFPLFAFLLVAGKKRTKNDSQNFGLSSCKMDLSFMEKGKTGVGESLGKKIRNSGVDVLTLRGLLDIQVETVRNN